jgi:DNA invertase Pin-like site-specific DNA recombinase
MNQKPPLATKAALYARTSTKEGRQHLQNQLIQLRDYAGRMDWTVTATYTDSESGAHHSRPGLDKLMEDAARREFDVVLVFDLSRLTRLGPARAFSYIERLNHAGVKFWSLREEHFRTVGPTGTLFIAIAAHIAEMERETMRARIQAGLHRARKQGKQIGRPPSEACANLSPERIERMRGAGLSIREIARKMKVSKTTIGRIVKGEK